ncbi:MAG TPA: biotin/lipoyl-binding protein, partial [Burkholderiaceae bacterium]
MAIRWSTTRTLFVLAGIGVAAGIAGAVVSNERPARQPPAFPPATDPYAQGIYANGIVETDLPNGSNINLYPEVSGTVSAVLVQEGQAVHRGDAILRLDDTTARAQAAQQRAQAVAAQA